MREQKCSLDLKKYIYLATYYRFIGLKKSIFKTESQALAITLHIALKCSNLKGNVYIIVFISFPVHSCV